MDGLLFHIIIPSFALLFGFHVHKNKSATPKSGIAD